MICLGTSGLGHQLVIPSQRDAKYHHSCPKCEHTTTTRWHMYDHCVQVHFKREMTAELVNQDNSCHLCGKQFKDSKSILTHLAASHGVVEKFMSSEYHIAKNTSPKKKVKKCSPMMKTGKTTKSKSGKNPCSLCEYKSTKLQSLYDHYACKHFSNQIVEKYGKEDMCALCEKVFRKSDDKWTRLAHIVTHNIIKEFLDEKAHEKPSANSPTASIQQPSDYQEQTFVRNEVDKCLTEKVHAKPSTHNPTATLRKSTDLQEKTSPEKCLEDSASENVPEKSARRSPAKTIEKPMESLKDVASYLESMTDSSDHLGEESEDGEETDDTEKLVDTSKPPRLPCALCSFTASKKRSLNDHYACKHFSNQIVERYDKDNKCSVCRLKLSGDKWTRLSHIVTHNVVEEFWNDNYKEETINSSKTASKIIKNKKEESNEDQPKPEPESSKEEIQFPMKDSDSCKAEFSDSDAESEDNMDEDTVNKLIQQLINKESPKKSPEKIVQRKPSAVSINDLIGSDDDFEDDNIIEEEEIVEELLGNKEANFDVIKLYKKKTTDLKPPRKDGIDEFDLLAKKSFAEKKKSSTDKKKSSTKKRNVDETNKTSKKKYSKVKLPKLSIDLSDVKPKIEPDQMTKYPAAHKIAPSKSKITKSKGKRFSESHIKTIVLPRDFQCELCTCKVREDNLLNHFKEEHPTIDPKGIRVVSLPNKKMLTIKEFLKNVFKCGDCSYLCGGKGSSSCIKVLLEHYKTNHPQRPTNVVPVTQLGLQCAHANCRQLSRNMAVLVQHLMTHTQVSALKIPFRDMDGDHSKELYIDNLSEFVSECQEEGCGMIFYDEKDEAKVEQAALAHFREKHAKGGDGQTRKEPSKSSAASTSGLVDKLNTFAAKKSPVKPSAKRGRPMKVCKKEDKSLVKYKKIDEKMPRRNSSALSVSYPGSPASIVDVDEINPQTENPLNHSETHFVEKESESIDKATLTKASDDNDKSFETTYYLDNLADIKQEVEVDFEEEIEDDIDISDDLAPFRTSSIDIEDDLAPFRQLQVELQYSHSKRRIMDSVYLVEPKTKNYTKKIIF